MRLIDVKPTDDNYGLPEARLVAPGHAVRSVRLRRMRHRDVGDTSPLATSLVDQRAVERMQEWIKQLKTNGR